MRPSVDRTSASITVGDNALIHGRVVTLRADADNHDPASIIDADLPDQVPTEIGYGPASFDLAAARNRARVR